MKAKSITIAALGILASISTAYGGRSPGPVPSTDDSVIKVTTVAQVGSLRAALIREIWGVPWSDIVARQPNKATDHYNPKTDPTDYALPNIDSGVVDRLEQGVLS